MGKKQLKCVCGHAENKHRDGLIYSEPSHCFVKGCDCDCWRWDRKGRPLMKEITHNK